LIEHEKGSTGSAPPLDLQELVHRAREAYGSGRLSDAGALCREILDARPDQPDAEALLGVIALQEESHDAAALHLASAIRSCPHVPEYRYNLGLALVGQGQSAAAAEQFREALALEPDFVAAHNNLANALKELGETEGARRHYERALALDAGHPGAHNNLAILLKDSGDHDAALMHVRMALHAAPRFADAWFNLGNTLRSVDRVDESIEAYREAVSLDPTFTDAWVGLGQLLQQSRRFQEAEDAYVAALRLDPAMADVHFSLGNLMCGLRREVDAIPHYRSAVEIDPTYAEAHCALGRALRKLSFYEAAVHTARRAIDTCPGSADAHALLGMLLTEQGLAHQALDELRRAIAMEPGDGNHSALIWALCCHPDYGADAILQEARRWQATHAEQPGGEPPAFANDPSPERRLKIGYMSPDFKRHPVGYFLASVIREHDRDAFEVMCFSSVLEKDDMTDELMGHADDWREIRELDDEALAGMIREARVDIVVDLAGHTRDNRLLTLARRVAPVQVCAGGHFCTTGVDAVDYLVSDWQQTPSGSEAHYSERLLRLPDGYVCYEPPDYAPSVTEPPMLEQGYVTFCCYNGLFKITPRVIDLWADIMTAVAGSRLRMQTGALNDEVTRNRYRDLFASRGVDGDRIELHGPVSHRDLLESYAHADIALDPFPYSGGLTTCESLWMGVPVVTLSGSTFAGRHSTSHLHNVGLPELVTPTEQGYVDTATRLAGDVERLTRMRRQLRPQMAASALCDGPRYTRDLEQALRGAWRSWCTAR
jgi:predicted O-linked N-acetylglucosamine transferase (SPINDLY family)